MNYVMPGSLDVDLVIVAMAYILIRHGTTGAAIFVFVQGLVLDFFSAGVLGLFTFLYLMAFLTVLFKVVLHNSYVQLYTCRGEYNFL